MNDETMSFVLGNSPFMGWGSEVSMGALSLPFKFYLWQNWTPDLPCNACATDTGLL
jgi:hypothetical protein